MTRALLARTLALAAALWPFAALALTPEAGEFIAIARKLENVHCEKRKLRHEIALAEVRGERARASELRAKFEAIGRDPQTRRLESRLGELERRISGGKGGSIDPRDLEAISAQHREAYLRCQ